MHACIYSGVNFSVAENLFGGWPKKTPKFSTTRYSVFLLRVLYSLKYLSGYFSQYSDCVVIVKVFVTQTFKYLDESLWCGVTIQM